MKNDRDSRAPVKREPGNANPSGRKYKRFQGTLEAVSGGSWVPQTVRHEQFYSDGPATDNARQPYVLSRLWNDKKS